MKTAAESGCASAAREPRDPNRLRRATGVVVALSGGLAAASAEAAAPAASGEGGPKCRSYELVRIIESPGCDSWPVLRYEANDTGVFVGAISCSVTTRAYRGRLDGEIEILGIPGQEEAYLRAVRDDGLAVGAVDFDGSHAWRGLLSWPDGRIELVDPPPGRHGVFFEAVNDAGVIAGWVLSEIGKSARLPVLFDLGSREFVLPDIGDWEEGTLTSVDAGGSAYGYIARWIPGVGSDSTPIRTDGREVVLLPELPKDSVAGVVAVSVAGDVLVTAHDRVVRTNYVLDADLRPITLATLVPGADTGVFAIDREGWVIGSGEQVAGVQANIVWRPDGCAFPILPGSVPGAESVITLGWPCTALPNGELLMAAVVEQPDGWPARHTAHLALASAAASEPADFDCDGVIGFDDLLYLLDRSGPCRGRACYADLDGDGAVGYGDLLELIAAWH